MRLSAGPERALFTLLGILDAHEDDYIRGLFGGIFNALLDTLIGAFDNAETKLAKFFVTIPHAYRMLSACRHVAACR